MPKIVYESKDFKPATLKLIGQANDIIVVYRGQGYDLTLRQLYYQFVARGFIENKPSEYKRLGEIVNDARVAGLIDWDAIVDRTRNLNRISSWASPADIIKASAESYREDLWIGQPCRPEVWIEKEALSGVFERICDELRVPFFACRGYCSQSEMWAAAQRLRRYVANGQRAVILHFGDHDPSGIDMTRDIKARLKLFRATVRVKRIALTMDQVDEYSPPPNPAKVNDSRFDGYQHEFGDDSWELDALDPNTLAGLVRDEVTALLNKERWDEAEEAEAENRKRLESATEHWGEVADFLDELN